jgi:predicted homoserine dehydrogenase-like protein
VAAEWARNLQSLLQQRVAAGTPVKAALIGTGKFGPMFLNQEPTMPGVEISVIADPDAERAQQAAAGSVGARHG